MPLVFLGGAAAVLYLIRDYGPTPWESLFQGASRRYGVPVGLLKGIARRESGLRANAVSPVNSNGTRDYGLMQVNTLHLNRFNVSTADALKPDVNIDMAARILSELRDQLGGRFSSFTWPAAYNVGPDLKPEVIGQTYASSVLYHWLLYDLRGIAG